MTKRDLTKDIQKFRCLIEKAEEHRLMGNLLEAAATTKKAGELLFVWRKKMPESKLLLIITSEKEKCWNKIIHDMIKNIQL